MVELTDAVKKGDRWAGGHGEDYPIEAGQVWQVGDHLLCCSDLMDSRLLDTTLDKHPPTLLYCDPPWGQGLVNSFRTKAGLAHATYRWEELYRRIAQLAHERQIPLYLEGSVLSSRDGQKIFSTMRPLDGPQHNRYWQIEYANHQPAGLYYSSTVPWPSILTDALTGLHDRHTPAAVMAAYGSDGTVLEPCCGLGGTPLNAAKVGWASVNNEINPYRMSAALASLSAATGLPAVQIA